VAPDDLVAQRPGDVECCRDLALLDASLGASSDLANVLPSQLRGPTRRLVQQHAGLEQPLLFRFRDPSLASSLVLRGDSDPPAMERRRGKQIARDRPVADVAQPSEIPIRRRDRTIRVSRFEALDCLRPFECFGRQRTEFSGQDVELTDHPIAALERAPR
jgi:hypothetical protein